MFPKTVLAATAAALLAAPALAEITIEDAYARSASPVAKAGAAFMTLVNTGETDDRLIAASSEVAKRVELHTHSENAEGVMMMMEVEEGFPIPARGSHTLARGGDHVMFMGLTGPWAHGDSLTVTLTFEEAGEMTVEIPVDLERQPAHGTMKMHGDEGS